MSSLPVWPACFWRSLIALLVCCAIATAANAYNLRDNIPAPKIPEDLPWLNVERPLQLADLRGRVVILDFWTYGCVNCIHVIAELKRLEAKYGRHLVVVGVHSPKFDNEKNIETLRRVLLRYDRVDPVVHDIDFRLMRLYGARAWPTLFVLDPAGGVVGKVSGEGNYELLDRVVGELLEAYADELSDSPLPLLPEKTRLQDAMLAFPGKIAVSDSLVALSDTLHHRILVTDHQGRVQHRFGGQAAGLVDGSTRRARFASPQGVAFGDGRLYVADTGNHAIRVIDLETAEVMTIAGTGKAGLIEKGGADARKVDLRSPWDVALDGDNLFVAMAGDHQIWALDLVSGHIGVYAGSGHEGVRDGALMDAEFSQPSGLSLAGDWLYVADAESSAVRRIHLREQRVETLVGTGLFDFGDRDGAFAQAQLQHPLGVAVLADGDVLVADTYNHKVKRLRIQARTVETLVGTGTPGDAQGPGTVAALNEPGGLAVLGNSVLIVDTNNGRVVRFSLQGAVAREWMVRE
jgi:thiol-disulfide isomerase/thioredoxin